MLLCLLMGRGGVPHPVLGGYTIQSWMGYPIPSHHWIGVTPSHVWMGGGYPSPCLEWGTPSSPGWGYPILCLDGIHQLNWVLPTWTWDGVPPPSRHRMGYPPGQLDGVTLCLDLGWGTHLPPGMGVPPTWTLDGAPPTWTWDRTPPPS